MANIRLWFYIDLIREDADKLNAYLKDNNVYFEPSENDIYVHFACYMTNEERRAANRFLHDVVFKVDE